ncbi:MAG: anthranilate phosphoribosyltransferase [Anaerolineae bacterium]
MNFSEIIARLVQRHALDEREAEQALTMVLEGDTTPAQTAAFLVALRMKGETIAEMTGFARAMRSKVIPVRTRRRDLVDISGTGGDYARTFNISTTAAFVAAGAGAAVAKHVDRSVSSRCSSADLLERLGICLALDPEQIAQCIDEVGIGFLYAPRLHPSLRYVAEARRDLGIQTVFDILAPLTNPAGAEARVLGVYAGSLTELLAGVLRVLGAVSAYVVYGADGMDEFSTTGVNKVSRLEGGTITTYALDSLEFDLPRASLHELSGGSVDENVAITQAILSGERGARRDIVVLNAAVALMAAGVAMDLRAGIQQAEAAIDSRAAWRKLQELGALTQKLKAA